MVKRDEFKGRDVVSISDFSREELDYIFEEAERIERDLDSEHRIFPHYADKMIFVYDINKLWGWTRKIMVAPFFENSTRTATSFQMAMLHMGGAVVDFDPERSSTKKGETLRDSGRTIECYVPHVVVSRTPDDGAARLLAEEFHIPFLNSGDGQNEHPTQTMLDLYTIREVLGRIDGVKIGFGGDLKLGRTVHSLLPSLSNYGGCKVIGVSPEGLEMPQHLVEAVRGRVDFESRGLDRLEETLRDVDIFYMTRIQKERLPVPEGAERDALYKRLASQYHLSLEMLEKVGNPTLRVMHPLPRVDEIDRKIDNTPYAYYFKQAQNGLFIRMALLNLLLGERNE